jgi:hypothetical protein
VSFIGFPAVIGKKNVLDFCNAKPPEDAQFLNRFVHNSLGGAAGFGSGEIT